MSKEKTLCPRRRKEAVIKRRLEPLLQEEMSLRVAGRIVPPKLKATIKKLEGRLGSIAELPSVAPCLLCGDDVDLNTGHLLAIRHWLDIKAGKLEMFGTGLDVAICEGCIHRITDYDDLITEEVED